MRLLQQLSLCLALLCFYVAINCDDRAVVIVPLADLSGGPLSNFRGNVATHYAAFPLSPDKGIFSCLRVHQLKFNEIVTIKSMTDKEVECEVPNLIFEAKRNPFWVLKKQLIPLTTLKKRIRLLHIPQPIDKDKSPTEYNRQVLTLAFSWYDKTTKRVYAAGTRFVRCPKKDTAQAYAVYLIDTAMWREYIVLVDKRSAFVYYPQDLRQSTLLYIKLLKRWAHARNGIIPYVYGGCGYQKSSTDTGFFRRSAKRFGRSVSFWQRRGIDEKPLAGFDCSNMIVCATQICGIPYYYKNTTSLVKHLRLIKTGEIIEEGDLLWYAGHVIVVSDVKKNLLIEAVGYDSGYGKVHEITLDKIFQGITNYAQLLSAFHSQQGLKRLHSNGKPYQSIDRFKILKLKSLQES